VYINYINYDVMDRSLISKSFSFAHITLQYVNSISSSLAWE